MRLLLLLLVLSTLTMTSCNKGSSKDEAETTAENANSVDNPADAMRKAMEAMGGDGKAVEPIDHRKLKELLPERVHGMERKEVASQSAGAMGFNISNAEADYESGGKRIKATITDTGGAGMAFMSMAAWSSMNLDREDQNGWERTSTYKGYKTYEKYSKTDKSSEFALIVENRFIVALNGYDCDVDDLKKFVDDLDLNELKKLGL